jgi:adenosyl cobinamide kinase/adenosyl cobinamide phosphate guanylyltransferase
MLILVTGGCRSGKSRFALELAERFEGPRVFLATAQPLDEEMKIRIEKHRRSRPPDWGVIEEPVEVPGALSRALLGAGTVIIDCLTLWISNLLCADNGFGEEEAEQHAQALVAQASSSGAAVIVITNEVGSGVVPVNHLARRFCDCAGRANQVIARAADEVYLMVSGMPIQIPHGERKQANDR